MMECIGKDIKSFQYMTAFCVGILRLSSTTASIWMSAVLPLLTTTDSVIGDILTHEEASWMLSSFGIGEAAGSLLIGVFLDRVGPKRILLLSSTLLTISWAFFGIANSMTMLILGRFIAGMGQGIAIFCSTIYMCEVASKDIRGRIGTIPSTMGTLGSVLVLTAGPYLQYIWLVLIFATFPIAFFFMFLFIPDSPYFLLKAGKKEDAKRSVTRFLGSSTSCEEVEAAVKEVVEIIERDSGTVSMKSALLAPNFRRSLIITLVAEIVTSFCGIGAITSYLQIILQYGNKSISTKLSSVIYGLVVIPGLILSMLLLDKLGRRPFFFISSLGACLTIIGEGVYLYLYDKVNLGQVTFLPVLCLTLYRFFISLGVLHLPNFIVGELFATNTKRIGALIMTFISGLLSFLNVKVFGSVFESWGIYTMCWFFGGVLLLGVLFSIFLLPETKGKAFSDIQEELSSKNKN